MCLAIPSRVAEVGEEEALVERGGVRRRVRLDLLDEEVKVGDYLLVHTGFAIRRIPPNEAEETLSLFDELIAAMEMEEDEAPLPGPG
jgi:hydrogenase expression/formation protein HypC